MSNTGFYNSFKAYALSPAGLDFVADDIRVALMSPAYTPDFDTEEFFGDINADEVVGTGYTAGGELLSNKAVTQDNTNNLGVFDADDTQWPSSTLSARGAVLYKDTGNPVTSKLIGYIDFVTTRTSSGGTFTLQWQSGGIVQTS